MRKSLFTHDTQDLRIEQFADEGVGRYCTGVCRDAGPGPGWEWGRAQHGCVRREAVWLHGIGGGAWLTVMSGSCT